MKLNILKLGFGLVICLNCIISYAQLVPMGAIYYQNKYLNNPAMAGINEGLNVQSGIRLQWSSLPGYPKAQFLSGDYQLNDKVGIGLILLNDEAGLIKSTKALASFAYHLPMDNRNAKLSFGLSLGYSDRYVDYSKYDGDISDTSVPNFNERGNYVDGSVGMAYNTHKLELQIAIPNLRNFTRKEINNGNVVDAEQFFASAGYKFPLLKNSADFLIEPKVCYRAVSGFNNIVDIGSVILFANQKVNILGFYHTSESFTAGLGAEALRNLHIQGLYTSGTSALRSQTNGTFEVNLKLKLF